MKTMCMGIAAVLFISLAPPAVFSSEDDCYEHGRRIGEVEQLPTGYRSKIYGTVEIASGKWAFRRVGRKRKAGCCNRGYLSGRRSTERLNLAPSLR